MVGDPRREYSLQCSEYPVNRTEMAEMARPKMVQRQSIPILKVMADYITHQQVHSASLSGGLASMGAAVPYAICTKFAHPGRPIALVGNGTMQ
jgi:thiamine pyrophosphate-dependent acetolactate synthase large subunit-like protein